MKADVEEVPTHPVNIYRCARCGRLYDWRRSASNALKMTYCSTLCEVADLGFSVDDMLRTLERSER